MSSKFVNIELYKGWNCSKKNSELNWEESQNESSQQIETKNCPTIMRVGISESCPIPRTEEGINHKIFNFTKFATKYVY